jgi:hypothetical protein
MARPRVFISSTFYDLRQIRVELDKFIESLGYEPVRNEEGDIPYGKEDALQSYCYKEIENVDILVSIIGSRYGSVATTEKSQEYSISQMELKTALAENKQVFVFIDKNVATEYETYSLNKGNSDIKYKYVDNPNIYKFIEEIKSLPNNNNIKEFETADDIISYLKEQFAGLFKQFIIDSKRVKEAYVIKDIEKTAKTLRELVDYLKVENHDKDEAISQIVKINHPLISKVRDVLSIKYNIYIEGRNDLEALLHSRGFEYDFFSGTWEKKQGSITINIHVSDRLFDSDGNLVYMKPGEWDDGLFFLTRTEDPDLPF